MTDSSKKIMVDALNFDDIKLNLKKYLSGQQQFKDYNFEGSGLSVMLDVLAYNTHYNALYNNMAINEMFLDSASKRDSVVSIAKMLGYTPKSMTCATAIIRLTVTGITTENNQLLLPARTKFTSVIEGINYSFLNLEDIIGEYNGSAFVFNNVQIIEGTYLIEKYIVSPQSRYIISNPNCDTSTIKVYVNDSSGTGTSSKYSLADDIISLNNLSEVYFLKEIESGLYEISFGDGSLGKKLSNGNMVTISYLTTHGDYANNCTQFTVSLNQFGGVSKTSLVTTQKSLGGTSLESIESVKFNAPRAYSMQNRAVTEEDYKNLVYRYYPNVDTVNVWGGEENIPPIYGKVFLSIKPKGADFLGFSDKEFIVNKILKPKSVITTLVQLVDPEYINININTTIYYNSNKTNLGLATLQAQVTNAILKYNDTDLLKFDGMFRYSKLGGLIDKTDPSIQSNITTITLHREVTPIFDYNNTYVVNLGNPIYYSGVPEYSVDTTGFFIPGSLDVYYIKDNGVGALQMYYKSGVVDNIINANVGSVDYVRGIITIKDLNITHLNSNIFELMIKPQSNDVVSIRHQIVRIDTSNIIVKVLADPISSGSGQGGNAYVFTPSR